MATSRSARRGNPPPGFASIQDIIDGNHNEGSLINIAGILTDFRAPVATRGQDWKCQMRIYDQSVQDEPDAAALLNIFRPEKEMPDAICGDMVLVFAAKVQYYRSSFSLCTHRTTDVYVFDSTKISKQVMDASKAMRPSTCSQHFRRPNKAECEFMSAMYRSFNKERLPTTSEFETMKINSTNKNMKFSELKDVQDGKFIDTVAQIVREPYDSGDRITLWISDYTENPSFYHHQLMGGRAQRDNPYGYMSKSGASVSKSEWSGPFGKLSMQVTCFEPHASAIRDQRFSAGTWVSMWNLQIKYGRNRANLEGFLREDRGFQENRINISEESTSSPETTREVVKNAIRRKHQYEKTRKIQIQEITEAAAAGAKRRAELNLGDQPAPKLNAKQRRNLKRARKGQAFREHPQRNGTVHPKNTAEDEVPSDLNPYVKCENGNRPAVSLADLLAPVEHEVSINDQVSRFSLPFVNANYRAHVRIIDFIPSRLEDFARAKKVSSEYAALSDHGDTDLDGASDTDDSSKVFRQWEWLFALRLEDATAPDGTPKRSLWTMVDNESAQMLLDLDASNLNEDDENLGRLRHRMFILWGDLEEHKAQLEDRALRSKPFGKAGPPADSDDDMGGPAEQATKYAFSNRTFACCIRQYGVKATPKSFQDGDNQVSRWQRMFGLFGTRISDI